jgi:hypothetical protein
MLALPLRGALKLLNASEKNHPLCTTWPTPLFRNDEFRETAQVFTTMVLGISLRSVDEQHHVSILLGGPGLLQIRQLRLAVFDFALPIKLAQHNHCDIHFHRSVLKLVEDFRRRSFETES